MSAPRFGRPTVRGPNNFVDDVFAFFSNYGQGADIAALARNVYTDYLDNSLVVDDGTSFAAPAVAGAAALLLGSTPISLPGGGQADQQGDR
jgi:subtilisin family serine protease